ncbi:MAG: UDP-N-acetylmuramoyl-tripeptide--D-alanyl-D-alanine ligase [Candidatus Buchananbacteria bacterium]|nr:UDP-N-acetylmuramoyl-tripeptide--D-alanyl-D-alanine ligase [Candidatus Buchananbacteria bacterium]
MKSQLKKILEQTLRIFAQAILSKYSPEVVAVTGSVGKTSTKEAIYQVLSSTYAVGTNLKNYNNELGIPLSIIGSESGGRSILKWLGVFLKALRLLIFKSKKYPNILVLEMGADRPGDIRYLTNFIPVNIGVVTSVAAVHLEFYENLEGIAKEKGSLIRSLKKTSYAVLNYDDQLVRSMAGKTDAKVITYGFNPAADISALEVSVSHEVDYRDVSTIQGISFKLKYQGKTVPVLLPKVLGRHLVYSSLAAAAVGIIYDLNLHTIVEALKNFEPPKGRMHIISGIKNSLIIDDTYNSSPLACHKALEQLAAINLDEFHSKFAVLGDMLELGVQTESAHQEVGKKVAELGIDYLITVGEMSRDIIRGALAEGMDKDRCFNFKNSVEAGKFLQQRISQGDVVLVKGSQGMRMEKAVKELMANPEQAALLLVRQDASWLA